MLPSIQCIFERWLAGFGVILAVVSVLAGFAWGLAQLLDCIVEGTGTIAAIVRRIAKIVAVIALTGFFTFCCYGLGKDLLTAFGICHLR